MRPGWRRGPASKTTAMACGLALAAAAASAAAAAPDPCAAPPSRPARVVKGRAAVERDFACPEGTASRNLVEVAEPGTRFLFRCLDAKGDESGPSEEWWASHDAPDELSLVMVGVRKALKAPKRGAIDVGRQILWSDGFGRIESRCHDDLGLEDGVHVTWAANGAVLERKAYAHGRRRGVWLRWDEAGTLRARVAYGERGAPTTVEKLYPAASGRADAPMLLGRTRDPFFADEPTRASPAARWTARRLDGSEAWSDVEAAPSRSRRWRPAGSALPLEGPWLLLPNAVLLRDAFGGLAVPEAKRTSDTRIESTLDDRRQLSVTIAPGEERTGARACLVLEGKEVACQSIARFAYDSAEILWSAAGYVRLLLDGPSSLSLVWDADHRQFLRRYEAPSEFFDARTLVFFPRVEGGPAAARLDDLQPAKDQPRPPPCLLKKVADVWLCDGYNVRCDGEYEILRVPTRQGVRECEASCTSLPALGGLLVAPTEPSWGACAKAFAGVEITGADGPAAPSR